MNNLLTISYGDTTDGAVALEAVLKIMADSGVILEIETVQLGAEMAKLGFAHGFDEEGLNKIRRARVLLKAPTVEDVATPLRAALVDDCVIFEAVAPTKEATLEAALEMLRHLGQDKIAELLSSSGH